MTLFTVLPGQRAEVVRALRDQLAARLPEEAPADLLFRLAELNRALGELGEAQRLYARCLRLSPDDGLFRQLLDVAGGQASVRDLPPGIARPSPFVLLHDVLAAPEQALLWQVLGAQQAAFRPARINRSSGDGGVDLTVRRALRMPAPPDIAALFLQRLQALVNAMDVEQRFALGVLDMSRADIDIASSGQGGHFIPHRDNVGLYAGRVLSFVYYFFRRPCRFAGGDLLLHDEAAAGQAAGYTRYTPCDNSLLIFPSYCLHQVLPVSCESADVLDGRLTVHGWFYSED